MKAVHSAKGETLKKLESSNRNKHAFGTWKSTQNFEMNEKNYSNFLSSRRRMEDNSEMEENGGEFRKVSIKRELYPSIEQPRGGNWSEFLR